MFRLRNEKFSYFGDVEATYARKTWMTIKRGSFDKVRYHMFVNNSTITMFRNKTIPETEPV